MKIITLIYLFRQASSNFFPPLWTKGHCSSDARRKRGKGAGEERQWEKYGGDMSRQVGQTDREPQNPLELEGEGVLEMSESVFSRIEF